MTPRTINSQQHLMTPRTINSIYFSEAVGGSSLFLIFWHHPNNCLQAIQNALAPPITKTSPPHSGPKVATLAQNPRIYRVWSHITDLQCTSILPAISCSQSNHSSFTWTLLCPSVTSSLNWKPRRNSELWPACWRWFRAMKRKWLLHPFLGSKYIQCTRDHNHSALWLTERGMRGIGIDFGGSPGTCPPIIEKCLCFHQLVSPLEPQIFGSPRYFWQVYISAYIWWS